MKRSFGTLTGNTTITVSLSDNQDLQLLLIQGGTGSYTVTWSGVTKWFTPAGTAPTLQTAVGASDCIQAWRANGVTYAMHIGDAGAAGSAGSAGATGMTWRRTYNSASTYAINDAVYLNGSSYIALQASSSTNAQQPDLAPTYWTGLAAGASGSGGGGSGGGGTETVDNFTRADSANISTGAPSGITYTAIAGTSLEILSNQLHDANSSGTAERYRCESVMTSTDHHAQVTLGLWTWTSGNSVQGGVACRYDSAANTAYWAFIQPFNGATQFRISVSKVVAGTETILSSSTALSAAPVAGDILKLVVAGTNVTAYYNGVSKVALTGESSITTGVRTGVFMTRSASTNVAFSELRFGA